MKYKDRLNFYALRSVPLVFVTGAIDLQATVVETVEALTGEYQYIYLWDIAKGMYVCECRETKAAMVYLQQATASPEIGNYTKSPMMALSCMSHISGQMFNETKGDKDTSGNKALFIFYMGDRIFNPNDNSQYLEAVQILINLRDELKGMNGCAIFVGINAPDVPELKEHIKIVEAPLPDDEALQKIVTEVQWDYETWYKTADSATKEDSPMHILTEAKKIEYASVLKGMSGFGAEQTVYTSTNSKGIVKELLLENAVQTINNTQGMSVYVGDGRGFNALGGLNSIKKYASRLIEGKLRLKLICYLDEIDKTLAGSSGGDSSGVSQGFLGALLSSMQDTNALGMLFTGVYGTAKSEFAKRFGEEADCLTVHLDLSGMKDSLVGKSEGNLRQALKVIESIGGTDGGIMYIATCNRINQLPAELKRRFNLGTFFFTFPNEEERAVIWKIYKTKYNIDDDEAVPDDRLTGAEIESTCRLADLMGCSLAEARKRIVPVAVTAKEEIDKLIAEAEGRYLSTTYDGTFTANSFSESVKQLKATGRKFSGG